MKLRPPMAQALRAQGMKVREIADHLGMSYGTALRSIKAKVVQADDNGTLSLGPGFAGARFVVQGNDLRYCAPEKPVVTTKIEKMKQQLLFPNFER